MAIVITGQGQEPQKQQQQREPAQEPAPVLQLAPAPDNADLEAEWERRESQPQEPQAGRSDNADLEAEWARRRDAQEQVILRTIGEAVKTDPDVRARAVTIGQQIGVPADMVERSPEVWRAIARQRAIAAMDLAKTSPRLAERLGDFEFARQAHDDLEHLGTWETMRARFEVGELQTELGMFGSWMLRGRVMTSEELQRIAFVRNRLRQLPQDSGPLGELSYFAGQMWSTLPATLSVSMATGLGSAGMAAVAGGEGPQGAITVPAAFLAGAGSGAGAAFIAQTYRTETGLDFFRNLDRGYDPTTAAISSVASGALKTGLEVVGLGGLARPLLRKAETKVAEGLVASTFGQAARDLAKDYAIGIGAEAGTEAAQTLVEDLAENIAFQLKEDKSGLAAPPGLGASLEDALQSAVQVAKGMVVLGALPGAVRFMADASRAQSAEQRARLFDQVIRGARDSKLLARNPDAYESVVRDAVADTPAENVLVDGKVFLQGMQDTNTTIDQLQAILPDVAPQVRAAAQSGGDVVIPTEQYAARLVRTPLGEFLQDKIRPDDDPNAMSLAEAEAHRQQQHEEADVLVAESAVRAARDTAAERSRDAVQATIQAQIAAAAGSSDAIQRQHVNAAAKLYATFVGIQAERLGITAEEFHARYPLTVQADSGQPGAVLFSAGEGRASYDPARLIATLNRDADASSFVHEAAHHFFNLYGVISQLPNAPEVIVNDMRRLVQLTDGSDLETWNKRTFEEQSKAHERFAYGWEQFVFEGKAPSAELEGLFRRFGRWLREIYKRVIGRIGADYKAKFGADLPGLTPELRQIMGRMVASEEAVAEAEEVRGAVPLFQTKEQAIAAGMGEDEWQFLQERQGWAHDEAVDDLSRARLRQMQWLKGARVRVLRELQRKKAAIRAQVREQVAADVAADPVYRALHWLQSGELPDGEKSDGVHKLQTEAAQAALPEPQRKKLLRVLSKAGVLADDGLPPDVVGRMFGVSGQSLVRELAAAPSIDAAIEAATDKRMLEEHGELQDQKRFDAAVDQALHNEASARFVAEELRFAAKATLPYRVMIAAAKQAAQQLLATKTLREIRPDLFAAAERRASNEAARAMRRGEHAAVVAAKRQQLLQNQLVRLAFAARQEIAEVERSFEKLWRADEKVAKTRNFDLVQAARYVVGKHGIGTAAQAAAARTYIERFKENNPDGYKEIEPLLADAALSEKPWKALTLDEVRDLHVTVEALWFKAGREMQFDLEGKRVEMAALAGRLRDRLMAIGLPDLVPGQTRQHSRRDEDVRDLRSAVATGTRIEHICNALGEDFTVYVWRPIKEGINAYRQQRNVLVARYEQLLSAHREAGHMPAGEIDAPELGPNGYTFSNKAELLGVLFHNGNESNRRRLLIGGRGDGQRWVADENNPLREDGRVDRSQLDALLSRLIAEGTLTKADFDLAQAVWDLLEDLKPDLQRVHRDQLGYYFKEIAPDPLSTPWGTYRGGYVPAAADAFLVQKARLQNQLAELDSDVRQMVPSVPRNMTKERVENAARPLSLDIRRLSGHIDSVLRYVHVQPAVRDVLRLLYHKEFAPVLERFDPTLLEKAFLPWLQRSAHQLSVEPGKNRRVDRAFRALRSNTGLAYMALYVSNAVQNLVGLFPAMLKSSPMHVMRGLLQYIGSPHETAGMLAKKSRFMADRMERQIFELQQRISDAVQERGPFGQAKDFAKKHAYVLQKLTQNPVDIACWLGAYNKAIADQGPGVDAVVAEREAVARADAAVRLSQGSNDPEDISAYEYGTEFHRLLTQFYGWFGNWLNLNFYEAQKTVRELGWRSGSPRLLGIYTLGVAAPMAIASAIASAMNGKTPVDDDDGDGVTDEWLAWFFGSQLRGLAASVPIVGQIGVAVWNHFDEKRWNDRFPSLPSVSALDRGLSALSNLRDGATGAEVRDVLTLMTVLTGVPVSVAGKPLQLAIGDGR